MAAKLRQFIVYSKVTFLVVVFIAIAVIVFKNRTYRTNFWPGANNEPVSTLWLMLATGVTAIIVFWVFSKTRRVMNEVRQLHAEQAMQQRLAEHDRLKQSLDAQERRIDEKIKRAMGDKGTPI